ncbi:MAG: hypothetical protein A4S12_02220 [Proteobacteria bacterium SG_bin5]|nr:MAG: hypothetical protein A4S12_02220 [Proteobacteria bacterium SG_bin5]
MALWRRRPVLGYGLALVLSVAATVARLVADALLPAGFPYLTFFPAVVITAFVAGAGPGIVAGLISFFAAWYFFVPPAYSFALNAGVVAAQGFFLLVVAVDIVLIEAMHRAYDRLNAARDQMAALYDQQRMLFGELQHRVANNMAFIGSILHFQKRQIANRPEAAAQALDEAQARLTIMGRVHRRLYDPSALDRPVREHLEALCADVIAASDRPDILCQVEAAPLTLDLTQLIALSLLVSETVTNSLKHAFIDRPTGKITLRLHDEGEALLLELRDDGRGLPAGAGGTTPGLGTRIVHGLAEQLRGTIETRSSPEGMVTRLRFPKR